MHFPPPSIAISAEFAIATLRSAGKVSMKRAPQGAIPLG